MDYAGFLRQQEAAIVEQFFANYNIAWIAVPDIDTLMQRQTFDGGMVAALPGFGPDEGVIWRDRRDRAELWVKSEDKAADGTDLYARAWRQFVQVIAGTSPLPELAGRKLQADHLYPETAAFRADLNFVRVLAVDARSNVLLGSTTEKFAANSKPGTFGRPRSATYFTLAKVSGFQGSLAHRNASGSVAAALLAHLRARGYTVPSDATPDGSLEFELTTNTLNWFRGDV
jgi:hypothetical protein